MALRRLLAPRKIRPSAARTRYRTQYRPQHWPRTWNSTWRLHAAALGLRILGYCCASYPSGERRVNANRFAARGEVPCTQRVARVRRPRLNLSGAILAKENRCEFSFLMWERFFAARLRPRRCLAAVMWRGGTADGRPRPHCHTPGGEGEP